MHTTDFSEVLKSAGLESVFNKAKPKHDVLSEMKKIEKSNNQHLAEKNLPDYLRTPTADELVEMRQFAIDLKKANKTMSKRQIRKATQQHFNIRIFR